MCVNKKSILLSLRLRSDVEKTLEKCGKLRQSLSGCEKYKENHCFCMNGFLENIFANIRESLEIVAGKALVNVRRERHEAVLGGTAKHVFLQEAS